MWKILILGTMVTAVSALGQRSYRDNSILATGNWYKLAVRQSGVHRVDMATLQALGINTQNLSSASIRLFGNGGGMLPEANSIARPDDLQENAIWVSDGGDGIFNGNDYFLFYAQGPDQWEKDSLNQRFRFKKNLYSDEAYYFLTIGGTGLRVTGQQTIPVPNRVQTTFRDRYAYELDTVNLLRSGKQWYGEEFGNAPGRVLTRNFTVNLPHLVPGTQVTLLSHVIARSTGASSSFAVRANNNTVLTHVLPAVGTGTYDLVATSSELFTGFQLTQNTLSLQYQYQPISVNAQGWLNWFQLFVVRQLNLAGLEQLAFRDWETVGPGNITEFRIQNAGSATQVWDVTEPAMPVALQPNLLGNEMRVVQTTSRLREFIAFNPQNLPRPQPAGTVPNQNLHALTARDYVVVTHPSLLTEAQRLANFHQQRGLRTVVVTIEQVYNEFASGTPDPGAIRDFVKMLYDKAGSVTTNRPRYLLLMGDASFDYKNRTPGNTNLVPSWQNDVSLDPLATYVSDDFFGFLDDNDDVNRFFPPPLLDVGIGRIPARTLQEARQVVDKILRYHEPASLGPWRREICLVADDEDNNLHFDDAEFHAATIAQNPLFQLQKIYLDAYRQVSGSGGQRYPEVNQAINNRIFSGTLIWNYSGHGGFRRLAEEVILDQDMVNTWTNVNKLPLFVTATCDFAPFDNPSIYSLGEDILLRERTGAIALLTTTRVVFAFSNRIINNAFFREALRPDAEGNFPTLGASLQQCKNVTYQSFGDVVNNRKFALLGDPALRLGFPKHRVRTLSINNNTPGTDTLRATNRYTITGEVTDVQGNRLQGFNGYAYPILYDKEQTLRTLGNDPGSIPADFRVQNNIIFRGKARVVNGTFSYTFVVPRTINYQFGNAKIAYYAENGETDAMGSESNVVIGGVGAGGITDNTGPEIKAYLNDERFVNGGITNETPVLLVRLFDSSGINTAGTGIGQDITATLNDDNNRYFILNEFYEADADSYQRGTVRFQMPRLEEGNHRLRIKAWDVMNNSSEYVLDFRVVKDADLKLERVYNYPNPFTTRTTFMFEHNRPGDVLQVGIRIFTVSGKLVNSLQRTINATGNRSFEIEWDGTDAFGRKVGRGVYIYRLEVKDSNGKRQSVIQKLVIL
ncbi:MAG: type IX secretion system sortase PorU [Lacibacter sp.]